MYHFSHLLVHSSVMLSIYALLRERAPEIFHLAKLKFYLSTHLTMTPHLMPLFNRVPMAFPYGTLQKAYPVSAVASRQQGRSFCPAMAPRVEGAGWGSGSRNN